VWELVTKGMQSLEIADEDDFAAFENNMRARSKYFSESLRYSTRNITDVIS